MVFSAQVMPIEDAPAIEGVTNVEKGSIVTYTPAETIADVTYKYEYSGEDVTLGDPQEDGSVEVTFGENATSGDLTLSLDNGEACGVGNSSTLAIKIAVISAGGGCVTTDGFVDSYSTSEAPVGVYYWGEPEIFDAQRVNEQLEITVTHAESVWAPMGMELNIGDEDDAVYIDASKQTTGYVSVTNPSDTDIEIY